MTAPSPPTRKLQLGGTHRLIPPAETVARMRRLMPVMGITRIANVTGLDFIGIPVVMVCRPNARSLSVSQGKGLDLDAARASGLMESIELYHAERVTLPLKLATLNELRFSHAMVDVNALPRISISPFHANLKLLWIEGFDLLNQQPIWLPYEMVHSNYTLPLPTGSGCFVMSSNGLASGNHPMEALIHGLCEVIERDATTLWYLQEEKMQDRVKLDLDAVDDPACRGILDRYARAGISVAAWDITSDVGIPVYFAVIIDRDGGESSLRMLYPTHGAGCHPIREVALLRALTEAAQSRLTFIAGSRDDGGRGKYRQARDHEVLARTRARIAGRGARLLSAAPSYPADTFEEDVVLLLGRLRAAGITQAAVVDLTRPEFEVPVVRVVVPGLESLHEAPGYVPGPRTERVLLARTDAPR